MRVSTPSRLPEKFCLAAALVAGCMGSVEAPLPPEDPGVSAPPIVREPPRRPGGDVSPPPPPLVEPAVKPCADPRVGPSPLLLLSRAEYDNTVADLLGETSRPARGFVREDEVAGFLSTSSMSTTSAVFDQFVQAAEVVADAALKRVGAVIGCDRAKLGDAKCASSFVESFASRAFRRPLVQDERDALLTQFQGQPSFEDGVRMVIVAVLQSPHFLYRVELGAPGGTGDRPVPLTGYELAARLSYFLWDTMPDAELTRAAASGELQDSTKLRAQAQRLLADKRATAVLRDFHFQWLKVFEVEAPGRDAKLFPGYSRELFASMQKEAGAFLDHLLRHGDGTVKAMLTSTVSFADQALATYYGRPAAAPASPGFAPPAGFSPVQLDPTQRGGLLTLPALLTITAKETRVDPIKRGAFVIEHLLCEPMPSPPDEVDTSLKAADPGKTLREQLKAHASQPACAACHNRIDPFGFAFDHYDAVGRYRERDELGGVIDTKATLDGQPFEGARGLAARLAETDRVRGCLARHWFRFAFGRAELEADACTLSDLDERLRRSGGDVRGLILDLVTSLAFRTLGGSP